MAGNVRELKNLAARVAALAEGERLNAVQVRLLLEQEEATPAAAVPAGPKPAGTSLRKSRAQVERAMLEEALVRTGGNKAAAARLLGIHRATLYYKLRRYGLA